MTVNAATGLLVNFARLEEPASDTAASVEKPALSWQDCRDAALAFLNDVFPEADRFLCAVETLEEEPQENAVFSFAPMLMMCPFTWGILLSG